MDLKLPEGGKNVNPPTERALAFYSTGWIVVSWSFLSRIQSNYGTWNLKIHREESPE